MQSEFDWERITQEARDDTDREVCEARLAAGEGMLVREGLEAQLREKGGLAGSTAANRVIDVTEDRETIARVSNATTIGPSIRFALDLRSVRASGSNRGSLKQVKGTPKEIQTERVSSSFLILVNFSLQEIKV